jgi:hypothetical protein
MPEIEIKALSDSPTIRLSCLRRISRLNRARLGRVGKESHSHCRSFISRQA